MVCAIGIDMSGEGDATRMTQAEQPVFLGGVAEKLTDRSIGTLRQDVWDAGDMVAHPLQV